MMLRHVPFLKNVFLYSITAFGGPQAHVAMMMKIFVDKTPYVTKEELLEYNAFCNLLPGASSTQTVTLIGYKRGGVPLAILTLLIWIAPACLLMGAFSFLLHYIDQSSLHTNIFKFVPSMAVGFLVYASVMAFGVSIRNTITWAIMFLCIPATYFLFRTPWIFPMLIVMGGIATNLSHKRIPQRETKPKKIKWWNIWLFASIFLIAGTISEVARKNDWPDRKPIHLFENTYRMGSLVFGGGQVLMPMMYEQFSVRPEIVREANPAAAKNVVSVDKDDMTTGMGIVRAMPGPVFSIASFTGGMALREGGKEAQLMGCIIGSIAIFLPSALLVLFFFPIWNNLKKYAVVYRSLEGINAAVVGIMIASTLFIMKDISLSSTSITSFVNIAVILCTFLLLQFTRIPSPLVVAACLTLGYFL
ncbi:MAG TPA: chromate transporter [Flavisolibacter sp.]|jgi:chromate transporter|nr:chromate transporter [Flavisolibacter sp.]